MRDRFFIDTNVIVYSFDPDSPDKSEKSRKLIKEALINRNGFISYQVIQEFINVATKNLVSLSVLKTVECI